MPTQTWISQVIITVFSATNMIWKSTRTVWFWEVKPSVRMRIVFGKLPKKTNGLSVILCGQDGIISEKSGMVQQSILTINLKIPPREWQAETVELTWTESRVQRLHIPESLLKERQVRLLQLILFTRRKSFVLPAGSWQRLWKAGHGMAVTENRRR